MNNATLGILGGLGPMSGVLFCEMLTEHTKAECDQDHLNFLLSSRADTPDRTDFILGISENDPAPSMISEVKKLTSAGADIIVIPCNTAHYFYERISEASPAPVINIIEQTVAFCKARGLSKVGVLATRGTASSGAYKTVFENANIDYETCNEQEQKIISDVIYNYIKKGIIPPKALFEGVADAMFSRGCEAVVLGCTELSLLKKSYCLGTEFIDSLEVLALSAIRICGKEAIGFDSELMKFHPERKNIYVIK